jgi:squalene-hopene/tetraprenyl-beta-curcumene cyclase
MRAIVALMAAMSATAAQAQEATREADVDRAIARGLEFLARDAIAWKEEYACASCHHASMVVWAMREAKQRGHAVDREVLADLNGWIAGAGDGKTSQARPEDRPGALNVKPVWFALALGADAEPDEAARKGLKELLATVEEDQAEDGSWVSWPKTRPPIFDSDEGMTALATLALQSAAPLGDESARAVRDRGIDWLAGRETDGDPQAVAIRLVVMARAGRPREEWEPLVRRIERGQNADGGWSQAAGMESDAWATGQALYALAEAGAGPDDPAVARGAAFLARTQRDDGSWPMTSRPIEPGGKGAENLVPITGAGSAWAVLGLVRSR